MDIILITTSSFGKDDSRVFSLIRKKGLEYKLNPFGRKLGEEEVKQLVREHKPVGLIAGVEPLTRKIFEAAENLKVISRCGIGVDNVDVSAAADLGIVVTNTPDGPTKPVAELTLGLILSLLRRIHVSDAFIRKTEWHRPMGNLLHGKTVGIIGCGRIGTQLARLLQPFDCKILGCDPACAKVEFFSMVTLDDLLRQSDIISLHVPYAEQNHHFFNIDRFRQMKVGAFFINAARGGLVDENALLEAIQSGHLAGAALDCFEREPYNGPLTGLNNVLLTAHIGSYAREGRILMEQQSVINLINELERADKVK